MTISHYLIHQECMKEDVCQYWLFIGGGPVLSSWAGLWKNLAFFLQVYWTTKKGATEQCSYRMLEQLCIEGYSFSYLFINCVYPYFSLVFFRVTQLQCYRRIIIAYFTSGFTISKIQVLKVRPNSKDQLSNEVTFKFFATATKQVKKGDKPKKNLNKIFWEQTWKAILRCCMVLRIKMYYTALHPLKELFPPLWRNQYSYS